MAMLTNAVALEALDVNKKIVSMFDALVKPGRISTITKCPVSRVNAVLHEAGRDVLEQRAVIAKNKAEVRRLNMCQAAERGETSVAKKYIKVGVRRQSEIDEMLVTREFTDSDISKALKIDFSHVHKRRLELKLPKVRCNKKTAEAIAADLKTEKFRTAAIALRNKVSEQTVRNIKKEITPEHLLLEIQEWRAKRYGS